MATPRVQIIQASAATAERRLRRPAHTFQLRHRPFQIQPFMIAPVLPGETMKNLLLQSRCVTQPIKNPLIGWWLEHYVFYVKHRDTSFSSSLQAMVLQHGHDLTAFHASANNTPYYTAKGTLPYVELCMEAIVNRYFRSEKEVDAGAWNSIAHGGVPVAAVQGDTWLDSVGYQAAFGTSLDTAEGATQELTDLDRLRQQYQAMTELEAVQMTYEEWLKTYGVRQPKTITPEENYPELIRYCREWQYPSNTIDPTNGTPRSAVSWGIAERADKDRLFKEPGFLFGVTVARPKVYMSKQVGNAASLLDTAFNWLPAALANEAAVSLKLVDDAKGPLNGNTGGNDYWVDVRDLFMYGDQFVNFSLADTSAGMVALPTAAMEKRYPSAADVEALFVSGATAPYVTQDGICTMQILTRQRDYT